MSVWKRFFHLRKNRKQTRTQAIRPFFCNTFPRTFTTKSGRANHSKSCSLGVTKDNNNNINSNNASEAPAAAQPPKSLTSSLSGREVDNVTQEQNDVQFTPLQEQLKYADMAYKACLLYTSPSPRDRG